MISAVVVVLSVIGARVDALIANDCTSTNVNISAISLKDVASCPDVEQYRSLSTEVQIVQRNEIKIQQVKTCLVEITRTIYHCGMHNHNSIVAGGLASFIHSLGAD